MNILQIRQNETKYVTNATKRQKKKKKPLSENERETDKEAKEKGLKSGGRLSHV